MRVINQCIMATVDDNLTGDLEVKKDKVVSRLQKRDDDRQVELTKRKQEKESTAVVGESRDFFFDKFNESREEIESKLKMSHALSKAELTNHLDSLILDIQKLQQFLTDSTMFITAYKVQQSQDSINQLYASVIETRERLMPKKKFAFKSKKKAGDIKPSEPVKAVETKKTLDVDMTECRFDDIQEQVLEKSPSEINQNDVALSRLTNCVVKLYGLPSAIHISHLKNCKIFSGPVAGSIFIDDCESCTFILSCQQLRIHSTKSTDFYIHVTSKAIIEDCNTVRFAPYNWNYTDLLAHYEASGLDRQRNNWSDVDDFNWLASDTGSPHWNILPENERVDSWDHM